MWTDTGFPSGAARGIMIVEPSDDRKRGNMNKTWTMIAVAIGLLAMVTLALD